MIFKKKNKDAHRLTRILYASDFHGSEAFFRKYLSAALQYQATVLVTGGDLTGKAMIPIVHQGGGRYVGVTAALALHHGYLPPTINQTDPDPACDLDFIPNVARAVAVRAALCNCLGFGSKNSAMVLGAGRQRQKRELGCR